MKDPALARRLYNAAVSSLASGQLPQARSTAEQVLKLVKYHAGATHLLAILEFHAGRTEKAVELAERAIRFDATDRSFHHTLSIALRALGRFAEAETPARQAVQLAPNDPEELAELGLVLASLGRDEEARACYERALAIAPDHPAPRMNYSALLLMRGGGEGSEGDFERGWAYFESRPSLAQLHRQWPGARFWSGAEDLSEGKHLLVHAEQGIGDTILFSRYLPLLAERYPGARITLACHPRLAPLIQRGLGDSIEAIHQAPSTPYPHANFHAGLLSMPLRCATTLATVPNRCPYLRPDAALVERWRERLSSAGGTKGSLKVGLAWAGNPKYTQDRARSIDLAQLAPLLRVPKVAWHSLQIGSPAEQMRQVPEAAAIGDLTPLQTDLAETAAMLANLDLIVSVDTAVANLAAALGRPAWVLLSNAADWRWLGETRESSRWFPTARLFRQSAPGQWSDAIARAAGELEKKTSGTA